MGPSVEAISEMNVLTNGYNAEYGRGAGGVVNVNLKSGTNQVHGGIFEFCRIETWTPTSGRTTWPASRAATYRQNQFGAAVGGPIIKNSSSSSATTRELSSTLRRGISGLGVSGYSTIPTPAEISGNFSSILGAVGTSTDANGNPVSFQKGAIYDPASTTGTGAAPISRTPFPGNIIPISRMDPVFSKIASLFPAPNQPIITGAQPTNDYYYATPGSQGTHQGDSRVDYKLSDKGSLFGSVSWSNTNKIKTPPFPGVLDDSGFTGATEQDLNRNGQISYTRVWNPTMVTESRASFTRLVTVRTTGSGTRRVHDLRYRRLRPNGQLR